MSEARRVQRCPVCGQSVPPKPKGTRGPKPVYCTVTLGACQEYAKYERLQLAALDAIVDRTSSNNESRMRNRVRAGIASHAAELKGELDSGMERRRRFGERRR